MTILRMAAVFLCIATSCVARAQPWVEVPMWADKVATGLLPPIEARLPAEPSVVSFDADSREIGRYGGDLRILMGKAKDTRLMVVYGYARLVGYDEAYNLVPDILASVDVEDDRIFTFRLRAGHRWSDGARFTTEDFRYYWEDIIGNDELSPFGPPRSLLVEDELPVFEIIDETTVRYTWTQPNPFFLATLAGARPETIYAPSHYMRQFHPRYGNQDTIDALVKKEKRRGWTELHTARFRPYKNINPDLPTLQPWVLETPPPSQRFTFVRNPFYHRVDSEGHQLPYIDRVYMSIVDGKLIPVKAGAGETDLQARNLSFSDYTFLKESEARNDSKIELWSTTKGSHLALFPNLNAEDPAWRELFRDVRFRRALSMGIDRTEINQVIYFGLAVEGNDTVFEQSPVFKADYRNRWAMFDVEQANALLDDIGLTKRNKSGVRLLSDGRPLEIIVETAGEDTEQVDVLELIGSSWRQIGVKLFSKPSQREVLRNRIWSGKALMSVWGGLENGLPTPDMSPRELAPTSQDQLQWPMWGQYVETGGEAGKPVDLPEAMRLAELNDKWLEARDRDAREAIWHQMLSIWADNVFSIGTVAAVPQPVVVRASLRNCPKQGIYNWDPGAHFGIYRPDTFWFAGK